MNKQNIIILVILIFMLNIYLFIDTKLFDNDKSKSIINRTIDSIYFTSSTLSTVGYGDIKPIHPISKLIVVVEQMFIIAVTYNILSSSILDKNY